MENASIPAANRRPTRGLAALHAHVQPPHQRFGTAVIAVYDGPLTATGSPRLLGKLQCAAGQLAKMLLVIEHGARAQGLPFTCSGRMTSNPNRGKT